MDWHWAITMSAECPRERGHLNRRILTDSGPRFCPPLGNSLVDDVDRSYNRFSLSTSCQFANKAQKYRAKKSYRRLRHGGR